MPDALGTPEEIDRRRIRMGLGILGVVLLIALVVAVASTDPLARLVMAGIVVFVVGRAFLLTRSLRKGR